MRNLAFAIALAVICACAGYSSGTTFTGGVPGSGGSLDAGGIPDGGDGGVDGGFDAGCEPRTLHVGAIDNCPSGTLFGTADVNVVAADAGNSACTVTMTLSTSSGACTGFASHGALDAFDGGCLGTGLTCASPSLPGTLTCSGGCTITICPGLVDGGACAP
jgi:hypothetical protein